MAEERDFENERISNSEGLMTLILDWVTWYTIMHHRPLETNQIFIQIRQPQKTRTGQPYVQSYIWMADRLY